MCFSGFRDRITEKSSSPSSATLILDLLSSEVGRLMGPRGERINALEKRSYCHLNLLKPTYDRPSPAIAVTGAPADIVVAVKLLEASLGHH